MGAWIETRGSCQYVKRRKSHPTWVRGLKHYSIDEEERRGHVAPYVGAWIETTDYHHKSIQIQSHPTWVRGLKPGGKGSIRLLPKVAPYVGAWIETLKGRCRLSRHLVAPYMGAWIETYSHNRNPHSYHVLLIVTHRLKQYKPEMCKPQMICIGFYRCCL